MLHPILALDHVIQEYREYLRSEFRAKDPGLREALERELDAPLFLAQEPFYQVHRPFKRGQRWRDLPIDPKLARVMTERARGHGAARPEYAYLHQSDAIAHLLGADASPIVVTTGTGSGKTEAFLLPVIQNAIDDATRFRRNGLTAILVYPMNALANDQLQRIEDYLQGSGFSGTVSVAKYDRGTSQADRDALRKNPPHILLTNYMMLEYLLVRPADRDGIFANHRCRFLVLDEVHTYRGALGANIGLLVRRLRAHLEEATQDWHAQVSADERPRRFPTLIPIGTSATIKSVSADEATPEEALRQRDEAVREFFSKLTGAEVDAIRVYGEELEEIQIPSEAAYPAQPSVPDPNSYSISDPETIRRALCGLAGQPGDMSHDEVARRCRLLWDLNRWLITSPLSLGSIGDRLQEEVPERREVPRDQLLAEAAAALVLGAALPDGTPGALRLRAHRFIRGGWRFHRCVNPECGRLYPMGEERCACGHYTAPLFLCRNCGAHYLRFVGDPESESLRPSAVLSDDPEWMLYEHELFTEAAPDEAEEEEEGARAGRGRARAAPKQIGGRPVLAGSFDVVGLNFSPVEGDYPLRATLVPRRTRCLCCGGTAGSRTVITPVSLGTSAAVKVLGEGLAEALAVANRGREGHDGKERLLIFSDSRQDAAHQARFIIFASRYDRMRRRLIRLLTERESLTIQQAVEELGALGTEQRDNPRVPEHTDWIPDEDLRRIRAWEEAPLLDDVAITAGYRGTVINLGLVGIQYHRLDEYAHAQGSDLGAALGVSLDDVAHLCRCMLDEIRRRGALSREMLRYHPNNPSCPAYVQTANWERRVPRPQGYAASDNGEPLAHRDAAEIPVGITRWNAWRRPGAGGRGPSLQRMINDLLRRMGGIEPHEEHMVDLLAFLRRGNFLVAPELHGARDRIRLLQLNADVVRLVRLDNDTRRRCSVCGTPLPFAGDSAPCPRCHGAAIVWPDAEVDQHRSVQRIRAAEIVPLIAEEHTAQVPNDQRVEIEDRFKAGPETSRLNTLACSPTLEMGIDVGGLDAVLLRNVPPRPDNYAQRGGRAGRRSRVGLVLGYARNTPHDQYFYDSPEEMISGEIRAPAVALGNRNVLLRHLNAIAFSICDPGIAGRMVEYVTPEGAVNQEQVDALLDGVRAAYDRALGLAHRIIGDEILAAAGLSVDQLRAELERLPEHVQDVVERTARQVQELRQALNNLYRSLIGVRAGGRAAELAARLLGLPSDTRRQGAEADDRSAGYPLRRLAEFGILPGYEFPTEPAALRLLGDEREDDPVMVARAFGISQFQPDARVHARGKRWRVIGLDTASPWNPRIDGPSWTYRVCRGCRLRYRADQPRCPRCRDDSPGRDLPAGEFGGFLAIRDEAPVLDEEERFATRNLVRIYPQWVGDVTGRWTVGPGWGLRLSRSEQVHWMNEGVPPSATDFDAGLPVLHDEGKGYLLCSACGRTLKPPPKDQRADGGRRQARRNQRRDPYGHAETCPHRGAPPQPWAIATTSQSEILRLMLPVPFDAQEEQIMPWGLSVGYSLLAGILHAYMLDTNELDFVLEGPWDVGSDAARHRVVALTFIDPSIGGTGYLERIASEFHLAAVHALRHLDHEGCENACYRCLKSYANQRFHEHLQWPIAEPHLEALAAEAPSARPLETGDIDDPGPWLEAYREGLGSPLELRFWRLFQQHGFEPTKQHPVAPTNEAAPISIADFAVPEARLAIYVDGASVHVGANLRRDRRIRERLRNGSPPWHVEELRAADLARGRELVNRLRALVSGMN